MCLFASTLMVFCTPAEAGVTKDINYAKTGEVSLKLDVIAPEGDGPYPIVLYVHGGGWSSGDKQADTPLLNVFHGTDVVVVSIDYRLAPAYRWPACLDDVNTAIRWVKANAAQYKGDSKRIALMGYSAGGQLACLAAVTANPDTAVQAVVGVASPTDLELDLPQRGGLSKSLQDLLNRPLEVNEEARAQLRDMSAIHHVHPGLPPFLLVHGTKDKSVPYPGSINFQAALRKVGVSCNLITLKDAEHRIRDWRHVDPDFGKKITDWVSATLATNPEATPATTQSN
jgi:alpha-L-fucosidase 2